MVYILCGVIIALCIKIYLLKKAAGEIAEKFADRLQTDTNTLINVSSRDRDMLRLAKNLNIQLKALREEHLLYHRGNTELKNAVTNISHDLRTPLTAICGYLYMIRQTDDRAQIDGYLDIIAERTEAMKQLTEELFRYSVILADESLPKADNVNVNKLLEDSIMAYYAAFEERGIKPLVNITEKAVIRLLDKGCLSRIFTNLLNNALKYSDGDLDITLDETGEISFANSASGLSSVQVEQLFDRFYTVEAARNSTGLGLSIARTLVERMGGAITAEYQNGRLTIRLVL